MSIGEVEDMLSREQKRKDERRRKKIKQLQKQDRHGNPTSSSRPSASGGGEFGTASGNSRGSHWVDTIVPGSLTRRRQGRQSTADGSRPGTPTGLAPDVVIVVTSPSEADDDIHRSSSRRRRRPSSPEEIELSPMSGVQNRDRDRDRDDDLEESISDAGSGSTGINATVIIPSTIQKIPFAPSLYTSAVLAWRTLTRAHRTAARAEVINAAGGNGGGGLNEEGGGGWGLGNFGLREREEAERR